VLDRDVYHYCSKITLLQISIRDYILNMASRIPLRHSLASKKTKKQSPLHERTCKTHNHQIKDSPIRITPLYTKSNCRTMYFIHSDIHTLPPAVFQGRVDILTCNPPYIPLNKRLTIDRSVSQYEPPQALFVPSQNGDEYYHTLLSIANRWETPAIVTEVGDLAQAERVKSLFESSDWQSSIWLDSAGEGRVVIAVKSEKWSFLLPQPDYSIPLDLSPFPRDEKPRWAQPGSILSSFRRPKVVTATRPTKVR